MFWLQYCIIGDGGRAFSCQCLLGTFGPDCDKHSDSPIAFNGQSYARWTLVNDIKTRLSVRLMFRTKQSDAVLMDAHGDRDYSRLEVSCRRVHLLLCLSLLIDIVSPEDVFMIIILVTSVDHLNRLLQVLFYSALFIPLNVYRLCMDNYNIPLSVGQVLPVL